MANLSGSLAQIGQVVLKAEAAQAYQAMVGAYGKDIPAIVGYASEWDLFDEAASCFVGSDPAMRQMLDVTIKPLLAKPDPTDADRTTVGNFFKGLGWGATDGSPNWDYTKQSILPKDTIWSHHQQWKTSWAHPYFPDGTEIYGVPNVIDKDPRRTGHYVIINTAGNESLIKWLFQNSYKYGFYWHGPLDGAFIYVGTQKQPTDKQKRALSFGYHANVYSLAEQGLNREPATEQDILGWINQKIASLGNSPMDVKEKEKYGWTHWPLVMNSF